MGFFNKTNKRVFTPKILRDRFGGVNKTKFFLVVDKTAPALKRSVKAATMLKADLPTDLEMKSSPLKELSSLASDSHVKTREASQNTELNMRKFLAIDTAL